MNKDAARAEATKIVEADPTKFALRSCWNCNLAHEHLKRADYIIRCFACGHIFYMGIDMTEETSGVD